MPTRPGNRRSSLGRTLVSIPLMAVIAMVVLQRALPEPVPPLPVDCDDTPVAFAPTRIELAGGAVMRRWRAPRGCHAASDARVRLVDARIALARARLHASGWALPSEFDVVLAVSPGADGLTHADGPDASMSIDPGLSGPRGRFVAVHELVHVAQTRYRGLHLADVDAEAQANAVAFVLAWDDRLYAQLLDGWRERFGGVGQGAEAGYLLGAFDAFLLARAGVTAMPALMSRLQRCRCPYRAAWYATVRARGVDVEAVAREWVGAILADPRQRQLAVRSLQLPDAYG